MTQTTLEPIDLERDRAMLVRWFEQPHVAQWWGDPDRAIQQVGECAPESHALIAIEGIPVGYLCWRRPPEHELEAADLADLPRGLVDIDICIGDVSAVGRGAGSRALELLLTRLRCDPAVAFAGVGTSASNTNAIRCFEKAGFVPHRGFQDPQWGPCQYFVQDVSGAGHNRALDSSSR